MTIAKGTFRSLALAATLALGAAAAHAEAPALKVLTTLDRFEPWEGHAFHAGHLWVGRSRQDLSAFYRLEVYEPNGATTTVKELTHSLRYIYPYDDKSVIVVGIGTDQLSHYTIATWTGRDVTLKTATLPLGALGDRWAGKPGALYFTDPGGFDDPGHPTPIGQPLQTVFSLSRGGSPRWLAPHIAGPTSPLLLGDNLYVLSAPTVFSGATTLHKISTKTESDAVLFDGRNNIRNMISLPILNLLAVAETGANQVLLFDLKTEQLGTPLAITDGNPRALAPLGHCLLVATEDTRLVHFFDLKATDHAKPLETWDLSGAGSALLGIRNLAADPVSGRVYARSAYACSPTEPCDAGRNSVVMAELPGSAAVKQCLAASAD